MKKFEAWMGDKLVYIRLSFFIRILIRISFRILLGKKRRDRLLKNHFPSQKNEVRDLFFFLARRFHCYGFLEMLPHEQNVQEVLRNLRGNLFVDVGANVGFYSFVLNRNFKRIIAAEPHPHNIQEVRKSAKSFGIGNIECVQKAVSNQDGVLPLFLSDGDSGHALGEWARKDEHIVVETITLQTLLKNFETVDLVKVDVEGAEWQVLEGSLPVIDKIKSWVIELHNLERKTELESLLSSLNYSVEWLDYNHIYAWRR